ncbi:hypothetical protein KQ945_08010 [Bacillus subtilis subsp. subtilis]|nr:hypothetical protein [Bacillus subtilis subsp. subtilis]
MLLTTAPHIAAPSPAASSEAAAAVAATPAVPLDIPLRGRALLARLEQLAQRELAQLPPQTDDAAAPTSALLGLAWDLGLSGDAVATTLQDPHRR